MFLWWMLDSMNSRHYYHHQNDKGIQEWRKEANHLAKDNVELRSKLEQLDLEVKTLKGTSIDTTYKPKSIDTDLMYSKETVTEYAKSYDPNDYD
jgi:uncharacterized protein YlxW (UPF0749 family)